MPQVPDYNLPPNPPQMDYHYQLVKHQNLKHKSKSAISQGNKP
jgi:hypothetical protein